MAVAKIDASIEPFEDGNLVYLPVAPPAKSQPASGMVNFLLTLTYRGLSGDPDDLAPGPPPEAIELTTVKVAFPRSSVASKTYVATGTLKRNRGFTVHLDELLATDAKSSKERGSIRIPDPAPSQIEISVTCDGFEPVTFGWPLAAHVSPTAEGSYGFPLKAKDFVDDQYVAPGAGHIADRSQHYAHDIGAVQWDGEAFVDNTGKEGNASKVIWQKPVYAVADGIVIYARDGSPDNPLPGRRAVVRGGAVERGPAGLVSIGTAGGSRIFSAVTDADDRVTMLAFEPSGDSDTLTFLGKSAPAFPFHGGEISLAVVSTVRAVTACAADDVLVLNSWTISKDAKMIAADDVVTVPNTAAAKVALLPRAAGDTVSPDRVVLARQPVTGSFELSVWELEPGGLPAKATATAAALGATPLFDLASLGSTRFVTAVQTASGKLRSIVWDVALDGEGKVTEVVRGKQRDGADASQIAVSATAHANQFAVATRNSDGDLVLSFFDVEEDGDVAANHSITRGQASLISLTLFKGNAMGMAVRTPAGTVKFIAIENELAEDDVVTWTIKEISDFDDPGGAVSAIALDAISTPDAGVTAAAALRTASGKLKLVLWRLAGNNAFQILHGDELVTYAHLRQGTMEEKLMMPGTRVAKGDLLAWAGNSGSSSGPHLHVHAVKFGADARFLTEAEIPPVIEHADALKGPFRPMVFHGIQATTAQPKPGGVEKNPEFGLVTSQGFYFDSFFVHPKAPE